MLSLDLELEQIGVWGEVVAARCPNDEFLEEVADPWFTHIGPTRARQYGVLGLNELGVPGVLAQVFNCYFRWQNMELVKAPLYAMHDVMRDTVGFATLTGIVSGVDPWKMRWWQWDAGEPGQWYRRLKGVWTEDWGGDTRQTEWSWALAVAQFNQTWDRTCCG